MRCAGDPGRRRAASALLAGALLLGGCAELLEEPPSPQAAAAPAAPVVAPPPRAASPPPAPPVAPPAPPLDPAAKQNARGERAYRKENYRAAERHFREALRLRPNSLHALTGLAWTLYDSGRPDEAFPYFRRANARYPKDGSARRGYAYLLYRHGRREEAKKLLGSLDPEQWPELANIDQELGRRGPPPPPAAGKGGEKTPIQEILTGLFAGKKGKGGRGDRTARIGRADRALLPAAKPTRKTMIRIPGGRFRMGNKNAGVLVEVRPFLIDKFEVTNARYAVFVRATGRKGPPYWRLPHFAGPLLPVVGVTWAEARAFCRWAGKRLPTEREWEFAAKGGEEGRRYPWGDKFQGRNAVYGLAPDRGGPRAVGRRPNGASRHGVEDLAGNAWEWVADAFRPDPTAKVPLRRQGVAWRTLRGGSWLNGRWGLTTTSRTGDRPDRRLPVYGFRCAADAP